jgi:transposase
MRARGEVSDADWAVLEPLLRFPQRADRRGRPPADTREVIERSAVDSAHRGAMAGIAQHVSAVPNRAWTVPAVGAERPVGESVAHTDRETAPRRKAESGRRLDRRQLRSCEKGGLAVGKTKRGKGTKIMAIAAGNSVPLAVTIDSASPHESKLVDETLAGSFLDELPEKLIGDKAYDSDRLR